MGSRIYFEFEPDETNFEKVKKELHCLVSELKNNGHKYLFAVNTPKCFDLEGQKNSLIGTALASTKIVNMILPGHRPEKEKLAEMCRNCKEKCNGLFSKEFIDEQQDIIHKRDLDDYNTLKFDYEEGYPIMGTKCNLDCKFCYNHHLPDHLMKPVKRQLTLEEVKHFVSYLPKIYQFGMSKYSRPTESILHPDFESILDVVDPYLENRYIMTNGFGLTDNMLKLLSKHDMELHLSVLSTSVEMRKKLMGYSKDIDIIALMKKLDKSNVRYVPWLLVTPDGIKSGDTELSVKRIINETKANCIEFTRPGCHRYHTDKQIIEMLNLSYKAYVSFVRGIIKKYGEQIKFSAHKVMPNDLSNEIIKKLDILKSLDHNIKYVLCCNIILVKFVEKVISRNKLHNITVCPVSPVTFGGNYYSTGLFTLEDYLLSLKKFSKKYDAVILPKISLSEKRFIDLTLKDLNWFYKKIQKPIILI